MVEVPDGGEIGRQQHRMDRMVSKHGSPSCSLPRRVAGAGYGWLTGLAWGSTIGSTHWARQAGGWNGSA